TALNLRSIPQRWGMSISTVLSIALVVGVLLAFGAMANGFQATLAGSGSDDIAVVLRKGAQAELNSGLSRDQTRLIREAPGLARNAAGDTMASAELYVIVDGIKRTTQTEVNLPLRGVESEAVNLRSGLRISQGRMFASGSNELIVGEAVLREFAGFDVGSEIKLGNNTWRVVGAFSTGGTAFESEIWTDAGVLQVLYQRGSSYQSMRVKLDGADGLEKLIAWAEAEPQVNLDIVTEKQFFASQAGQLSSIIMYMGWPLSIIMAIGALAGAWNAMYASVDARTREIATLRTLGFSGFAAFVGTMIEALLLSFIGGIIGSLFAYLLFNGISTSTLGAGFTQVVFLFEVTTSSIITGIILALIVGFLGGVAPSIRASRISLLAVHGD
ncbi:MAG: ABC transporter permease, partial [Robiginitomaculum sp.]|nr:ABC transporter permease [Robiginitomaculum sp.]